MAGSDLLLRVQELGGSWLSIGTERSRGIWIDPTNFSCDADLWGTRQLQALVRYDPRVLQPHLSAFTPWELEVGCVPYASGRISETPSTDGDDRSMTITGEGWQYHTDDDAFQLQYVHTSLTDWQDARQGLFTDLAVGDYAAAGTVSTDNQGAIVFSSPANTLYPTGRRIGVYLDLGPDTTCAYASVDYQSSNNTTAETLHVRGQNAPQFGSQDGSYAAVDAATVVNFPNPSGTLNGSFATPSRYIVIYTIATAGDTPTQDVWWKLTGIRLYNDVALQSGGQSALLGSTIVKDAISRATLLISRDFSQVPNTNFVIPEFAMTGYSTPRTAIQNALAFDDVIPRITVEKQISVRARPTLPIYEVGDWAGAEFQDASTNSGDQIFNSVVVTGTDAAGSPIVVRRSQPAPFYSPSPIQPTNPSATVNTTGWAASGAGTLSRDTVTFDTTPGAFKVALASPGDLGMSTAAWTGGTFIPGQSYLLTFRLQVTGPVAPISAFVTDANGSVIGFINPGVPGSWATKTITFTPQTTGNPTFGVAGSAGAAASIWVDSLALQQGAATLVDRRAFRRTYNLDTNMSLTVAAAAAIGDVYLAGHKTTPFKGTLNLVGPGSIRKIRGGQSVAMGELLRNTGELIQFSHLTDPDTGGLGRYGRIISAALSGPQSATVQIDDTRDNFQDFINRIQINTAQVR